MTENSKTNKHSLQQQRWAGGGGCFSLPERVQEGENHVSLCAGLWEVKRLEGDTDHCFWPAQISESLRGIWINEATWQGSWHGKFQNEWQARKITCSRWVDQFVELYFAQTQTLTSCKRSLLLSTATQYRSFSVLISCWILLKCAVIWRWFHFNNLLNLLKFTQAQVRALTNENMHKNSYLFSILSTD